MSFICCVDATVRLPVNHILGIGPRVRRPLSGPGIGGFSDNVSGAGEHIPSTAWGRTFVLVKQAATPSNALEALFPGPLHLECALRCRGKTSHEDTAPCSNNPAREPFGNGHVLRQSRAWRPGSPAMRKPWDGIACVSASDIEQRRRAQECCRIGSMATARTAESDRSSILEKRAQHLEIDPAVLTENGVGRIAEAIL